VILVAGEALIDFFPTSCGKEKAFVYRPGGSPYNVAIGLGRLKVPVAFLGCLSGDLFGQLLLSNLKENGVSLDYVIKVGKPTALSFVQLGESGEPEFYFYGQDTADTSLTYNHIPDHLDQGICALHLGSLAMVREPSGSVLTELMEREHSQRVISLDPNVRPDQIPDRDAYLKKLNRWVQSVDIFKLSYSDLTYLAPDVPPGEMAHRWLSMGVQLVVMTQGPKGAVAYTQSQSVAVESPQVRVVDSVGAGDAFTAAFLAALYFLKTLEKQALAEINPATLRRALKFAVRAAALACTRKGADPPRLSELGPL